MAKVIYKYAIQPNDKGEVVLDLPSAAMVLDVQPQMGDLQMWALVDKAQPVQKRKFVMYMTGQELPSYPGEHVATFQAMALSPDGVAPIVSHLFEVPFHGTN